MPRLSEQQKADRRQRILEGARRCFARYGYEGATVVRLERETGMSRGAIFNWFPTKQELFLALAAGDNERLLRLFAEEGIEALLTALTEIEPDWLAVYLEFGRLLRADAELRERWKTLPSQDARNRSRAWIEAGQADGRLRNDVTAEQLSRFLGVLVDGIVVQRALGFEVPDASLLNRLTSDAVAAPRARRRRTAVAHPQESSSAA